MSNEKHLTANLENTPLGGVKTAEARLNAVSHGLLSKEVLLPGEDRAVLTSYREKCMAELQPQGELETMLVERIISSFWRLKRAVRIERQCSQRTPLEDAEKNDFLIGGDYRYQSWQNYMRYETALENQVYKAMHELERLQRARGGENTPLPLAVDVAVSPFSNRLD